MAWTHARAAAASEQDEDGKETEHKTETDEDDDSDEDRRQTHLSRVLHKRRLEAVLPAPYVIDDRAALEILHDEKKPSTPLVDAAPPPQERPHRYLRNSIEINHPWVANSLEHL